MSCTAFASGLSNIAIIWLIQPINIHEGILALYKLLPKLEVNQSDDAHSKIFTDKF